MALNIFRKAFDVLFDHTLHNDDRLRKASDVFRNAFDLSFEIFRKAFDAFRSYPIFSDHKATYFARS